MLLLLLACTDAPVGPPVPPPCDATGHHVVVAACTVEDDRPRPTGSAIDPPPVHIERDVGVGHAVIDGDCWAEVAWLDEPCLDDAAGYVDGLAVEGECGCIDDPVLTWTPSTQR